MEGKVRRGDIYWVMPSPYHGNGENTIRSNRPGIIVSNDSVNSQNFNYEIVYLTTQPKVDQPTHCTIRSADKPSTAICEQIQTISVEQLGSYIGTCSLNEMAAIDLCIMTSLGLNIDKRQKEEPVMVQKATAQDNTELFNLRLRLAKAAHGEEIMKELYTDLLNKTLKLDITESIR